MIKTYDDIWNTTIKGKGMNTGYLTKYSWAYQLQDLMFLHALNTGNNIKWCWSTLSTGTWTIIRVNEEVPLIRLQTKMKISTLYLSLDLKVLSSMEDLRDRGWELNFCGWNRNTPAKLRVCSSSSNESTTSLE